ncbi:MAG: O-antigen ligase family protein [Acidimicrobiales bacterium]
MAIPLRLPTPIADRNVGSGPRPVIAAVEVAALVSGAGALAFLSSDRTILLILGVVLIVVTAFALVLSRPSVVVEVAIVTMWFDSVGAGPVRTGRVVSALAVFVLFARLAASDWKPPALLARAWALPAAFFIWAFVSGFWANEMGSWITGLLELSLGFIYALIIMLFIENEEHLARSFKAWVWTGVPIAIISYIFFNKIDEVQADIGGENRIVGFTGNANAYAMLLAVAVPVTLVFVRRAKTQWERAMYLLFIFGFMVALVTTGSRAGLIAMGVIVMYLFVTYPGLNRQQRIKSSIGGVAFVVIGVFLAGIMNPDRYSLLGFFGDAGAGRLELWNAATSSFNLRPIQGFSIGAFRTQMLDVLTKAPDGTLDITKPIANRSAGGLEVHNTYLTILLDLGIIGFVIFMTTQLAVFRNLWDLRKTQWRDWSWALIGCNIALMCGAFFGSGYNLKFQWTIVGVSGAAFVRMRSTGRGDRVRGHRGLPALRESIRPTPDPTVPAFAGERAFAAPMDVRMRYPFRWMMLGVVVAGFLAGYVGAGVFGTPTYSTYDRVLVLNLDKNDPRFGVQITDSRIQFVLNIARSERYLAEVKNRAGLDDSLDDLASMIDSTRPGFSPIIRITATTGDPEKTKRIGAVLLPSLDALIDSARSGALVVVSADERSVSPDIDPDYRGPLYLHLFDDPVTTESAPRKVYCGFLGAGLGGLLVVLGGMLAHGRRRLTSSEDISEILGIPFVASMPRPVLGRASDPVSIYRAVGDQIDDACAATPRVVALVSNDLSTLQSRVSIGAAAGLSMVSEAPIVVVDLDIRSGSLSRQLGLRRRRGIIDVAVARAASGDAAASPTLDEVRRCIPVWRIPRTFRRLTKGHRDRLTVIPVGGRKTLTDEHSVLDESALALLVGELASTSLVVLNLPPVPGPLPVREILLLCDAVLVTVLDGWTEVEAAQTSIDALEAAVPNRVGYLLVDQ